MLHVSMGTTQSLVQNKPNYFLKLFFKKHLFRKNFLNFIAFTRNWVTSYPKFNLIFSFKKVRGSITPNYSFRLLNASYALVKGGYLLGKYSPVSPANRITVLGNKSLLLSIQIFFFKVIG